jgi:hypothetical protein
MKGFEMRKAALGRRGWKFLLLFVRNHPQSTQAGGRGFHTTQVKEEERGFQYSTGLRKWGGVPYHTG